MCGASLPVSCDDVLSAAFLPCICTHVYWDTHAAAVVVVEAAPEQASTAHGDSDSTEGAAGGGQMNRSSVCVHCHQVIAGDLNFPRPMKSLVADLELAVHGAATARMAHQQQSVLVAAHLELCASTTRRLVCSCGSQTVTVRERFQRHALLTQVAALCAEKTELMVRACALVSSTNGHTCSR
jgi:hypothetical protein